MPLPENNNYDAMNQGIDRITEILKQQSTPAPFSSYMPQAMGLPANLLNAIAYSSYDPGNGKGGNFVQNAQNFQHTMQADQLGQQEALLKTYEMKLKMGDAQTKALDDKITLFTGNDPQGKALFLQALHDDPESIDPANSYQVMTKLAGIKKKTGYESPDLTLDKAKKQAEVNLINAHANAYNTKASGSGAVTKPMPVGAVKLENEAREKIGLANSIEADLGQVTESIDNGNLDLGLMNNSINSARNYLGMSTPESRNFNTFKSTLEKLRNDSLRLNKGVQTEGDAVRAWNEILSNINDKDLVRQRLTEVQEINKRAAALQEMDMNAVRANYGKEPADLSGYNVEGAILKNTGSPQKGVIEDGYEFLGGDPSKPENWRKQ